ncbi:MAG: PEP-CTERM sorting domain-containing protein [Pirellulales bacterium]|nr:PEP-CTERM sorting domain-containing protein [Pirellulales bacterium]
MIISLIDQVAALKFVFGFLSVTVWSISTALGVEIDLTLGDQENDKDATLYSYDIGTYDPADWTTYPKADGTSHIHAGDTNKNHGVQRGLIQFDLSDVPSGAIITHASLTMTVADIPNRVLQRDMNFWLVAIEGLSEDWKQGPGGEQSPAVPGDTTWFHTEYNPLLHGELGNTTDNEFRGFVAGDAGYWPAPGYFGQDDLLSTAPGADVGGTFDDVHALVFEQGMYIGQTVNWSNFRLIHDIQMWSNGSKNNFGWILIGEEWIDDDNWVFRQDIQQWDYASSKIDFFSSESANEYNSPPVLQVTYRLPQELVPGDANADDSVDVSDLGILAAYYGTIGGAFWSNGDFNNDHNVDVSDLGILASTYGTGSGSMASQAVPEASTLVLLVSGLMMSLWRRRR